MTMTVMDRATRSLGRGLPPPSMLQRRDRDFIGLLGAYSEHGGLARGAFLAHGWAARGGGDSRSLESLIVSSQVFSFGWHDAFWVPLFQFEPCRRTVRTATRAVLAELGTVLDGWALAFWFVSPHTWLGGERPIDLLDDRLDDVLAAARADRYAAAS